MRTMKFHRLLLFVLVSVGAGLISAFVALQFLPAQQQSAPTLVHSSGPASYADAVQQAAPAVVNIYTARIQKAKPQNPLSSDPIYQRFFGGQATPTPAKKRKNGLGSGVIISSDGYVMTNYHVIKGADEIRLALTDGRVIEADFIGGDPDTDLALLLAKEKNLPAIRIGNSGNIRVGDVTLAIGNPFGVGQTVTMGIVGATGRSKLGINTFEDFIQTDAAINPGNSGGALINTAGELVGINTAIFSKSGGSHGIGFAIPIDLAKDVMTQILQQGRVIRGWLGVSGQDITPEAAAPLGFKPVSGILISGVLERGPADLAGINPGDIITKIDGAAATNAYAAMNRIAGLAPGTKVHLEGWRGQQPFAVEAVISERPIETD
jgi:Do/DeqQ family serine protease